MGEDRGWVVIKLYTSARDHLEAIQTIDTCVLGGLFWASIEHDVEEPCLYHLKKIITAVKVLSS